MAPSLFFLLFLLQIVALCARQVVAQNGPKTWTTSPFNPGALPLAVRSPYLNTWAAQGNNPNSVNNLWPTLWNGNVRCPIHFLLTVLQTSRRRDARHFLPSQLSLFTGRAQRSTLSPLRKITQLTISLQITGWYAAVTVDGIAYRVLGDAPIQNTTTANQTSVIFTPTQTSVLLQAGPVNINATFLSPIEVRSNLIEASLVD